ncbi:MAG: BREX system P-loop protein BrxC [Candidatus Omnitrophica bacterium]|nr:BREX system P-loop protein BrxC [Candidatus Omnitrophota bacterium]
MQIYDIFAKPIDRDIKGVITIGQEQDDEIQQELSEYVVTRELNRHFHDFFESFTKSLDSPTDKMGVWISGFFGSGKSHFLKIISYLLENRKVHGKSALEYFKKKIEDPLLYSDMARSVEKGDLEVIIFNIDSKSSSDSKSKKDAIVDVFNKVFNERQGFSGEISWLAEMECTMQREGSYDAFKQAYAEIGGQSWEEGRDIFYYDRDNIVEALSKAAGLSNESAGKWFDDGEKSYSLSIEKFCKNVKEYCDAKGPAHKILFLVDEVGQYVGDNRDLMLNLQTVAEDLGKLLRGRAWIVVTSQEAIDTLTQVKGNDFSKIMGRFGTRLNLSSANTDEVIKKRLLTKTKTAEETLKAFYGEKSAIVKNLISFSSNTAEMKSYAAPGEFLELYPFIPYQFNLMQKVFEQIRRMGATGKHLSEGERSMLSAFQDAAVSVRGSEIGSLVPLYSFYNALEAFLDSNIRRVFLQAQDNSRLQKQDIELLKILFMIKYVKEVRPNIENLTTLSLPHVDADKIELKKQITQSLQRLKKETLINQNGDEYNFLTHEEQDVNREIQQVEIDETEVIDYASEILFEELYKDSKFKYTRNRVFGFNKKVDNRIRGAQTNEITLWVITPNHDWSDMDRQILMAKTIEYSDCVILRLPPNGGYLDEIRTVKKTEKYLRLKNSMSNPESLQKILGDKQFEAKGMKSRILMEMEEAVKGAEIFFGGRDIPFTGRSPKDVMEFALQNLVQNIYPYFDYITHPAGSPDDIRTILHANDIEESTLFDISANRLALDEIERFIAMETQMHHKITLKNLQNKFTRAPYGWSELDVSGLASRMIVVKKIIARCGGEVLSRKDKTLHEYFIKAPLAEKFVVTPREDVSALLKDNVKRTVKELTGQSSYPKDEDELAETIRALLADRLKEAQALQMHYQKRDYPGRAVVDQCIELYEDILKKKENKPFFEAIDGGKDDLLDLHDDLEPVKGFFKNMAGIFDKASKSLDRFERNKLYLSEESKGKLEEIQSILSSENPYNRIKDLPSLVDSISEDYTGQLEKLIARGKPLLASQRSVVVDALFGDQVEESRHGEFLKPFDDLAAEMEQYQDCNQAAAVESHLEALVDHALKKIEELTPDDDDGGGDDDEPPAPAVQNVNLKSLVSVSKILHDQDELEQWLDDVRRELEVFLNDKKQIRLY